MDENGFTEIDEDDKPDPLTDLLERAERSLLNKHDNKYWVTREELFLLAEQPDLDQKPRISKDSGGNWIIEIFYSKMIFIHATSFQNFAGEMVQ